MVYSLRWTWYYVRWIMHLAYAAVGTLGKPGTRKVIPVVLVGAYIYLETRADFRTMADACSAAFFNGLFGNSDIIDGAVKIHPIIPTLMWVLLTMAAIAVVSAAYVAFSRILNLILGIFPPIVRPLQPLKPLAAAEEFPKPVPVRLAVPRLPKLTEGK